MFVRGAAAVLILSSITTVEAETISATAKVDEGAKKVVVEIGGKRFTELVYGGRMKPVYFPIIGPGENVMVRQWPMLGAALGEEQDHPHHRGLWFAHGSVNGVDFWKETPDAGRIMLLGVPEILAGQGTVTVRTRESWRRPDGTEVMTSMTEVTCGADVAEQGVAAGKDGEADRFLDYVVTMTAGAGAVVFGDTKEGTMALRTSAVLNLKGPVAQGTAMTSEGKSGAAAWGSHARWVDYSAPMTGGVTGVACFDHPSNLRHPTTWHARDYGLLAANPFGLHDFQNQPAGAGDFVLKKGETLTLRYRWLFHRKATAEAGIEARWQRWAAGKP